jgi:hypothetical protein
MSSRRWWRNSDLLKSVLTIAYFDRLGYPDSHNLTSRTARCGPACQVVWRRFGLGAVPYANWGLENSRRLAKI